MQLTLALIAGIQCLHWISHVLLTAYYLLGRCYLQRQFQGLLWWIQTYWYIYPYQDYLRTSHLMGKHCSPGGHGINPLEALWWNWCAFKPGHSLGACIYGCTHRLVWKLKTVPSTNTKTYCCCAVLTASGCCSPQVRSLPSDISTICLALMIPSAWHHPPSSLETQPSRSHFQVGQFPLERMPAL